MIKKTKKMNLNFESMKFNNIDLKCNFGIITDYRKTKLFLKHDFFFFNLLTVSTY